MEYERCITQQFACRAQVADFIGLVYELSTTDMGYYPQTCNQSCTQISEGDG